MKRMPEAVFWTAAAGMELSWVYAWAASIMDAVIKRPYPLPEAVAMFVTASLLTAFIRDRGWRIIQILLLHTAGWAAFAFRGVHQLWYPSEAFWTFDWLGNFFSRTREPYGWFSLAVFGIWTIVFWVRGVRFAQRPTSFLEISIRFDKGLTWLFALLLIKLVIRTQIGAQLIEPFSDGLIFPFFIFGLTAVALARNRSGGQRGFMTGYRGIGLMISFSAAVLFCGTGLVLLFMPYLRAASQIGYAVLKTSGKFIEPFLVKILMFIFGFKPRLSAPAGAPSSNRLVQPVPESPPSGWMELFMKIFIWVFWVLLGLLLAFILGIGVWYLWRWLFSRTRKTERSGRGPHFFGDRLERAISYLQQLYKKLFGRKQGHETIRLYESLLKWGRCSGIGNRPSETPLEYGRRLEKSFSARTAEFHTIVAAFNQHVYGQAAGLQEEIVRARQALKKLRSPFLWPKRFKLWFLSSG